MRTPSAPLDTSGCSNSPLLSDARPAALRTPCAPSGTSGGSSSPPLRPAATRSPSAPLDTVDCSNSPPLSSARSSALRSPSVPLGTSGGYPSGISGARSLGAVARSNSPIRLSPNRPDPHAACSSPPYDVVHRQHSPYWEDLSTDLLRSVSELMPPPVAAPFSPPRGAAPLGLFGTRLPPETALQAAPGALLAAAGAFQGKQAALAAPPTAEQSTCAAMQAAPGALQAAPGALQAAPGARETVSEGGMSPSVVNGRGGKRSITEEAAACSSEPAVHRAGSDGWPELSNTTTLGRHVRPPKAERASPLVASPMSGSSLAPAACGAGKTRSSVAASTSPASAASNAPRVPASPSSHAGKAPLSPASQAGKVPLSPGAQAGKAPPASPASQAGRGAPSSPAPQAGKVPSSPGSQGGKSKKSLPVNWRR